MAKTKLTIKNFSGMGKGTYYLDRMESQKIGGQDILTTGWYTSKNVDENDTSFTNLTIINAFNYMTYGTSSALDTHVLAMGNSGLMFDFSSLQASDNLGEIHDIDSAGSGVNQVVSTDYPDITTSTNNNILYTSAGHLGRGTIYTATGGSTTTIVVAGEDFSAQTPPPVDGDRLYNVTKKEEYTIDTGGVGTTTLTLVTGTACEADDVFILFDDNFQKFNVSQAVNQQFTGQPAPASWIRQIKLLEDSYYVLNGNWLSSLNVDESTWSEETKQLPKQYQSTCFDVNKSNVLVGASYQGQGKLLLWDAYSDGWLSNIDIDMPPDSIRAYGSGWIVMAHNKMFYTDGYQISIMTSVPDMDDFRKLFNTHYNGVEIIGKDIIISADPDLQNRAKTGVWIYNIENGWSYTPFDNDNGYTYTGSVGALGKIYSWGTPNLYASVNDVRGTNNFLIDNVYQGAGTKYSAMFYVKLPQKMRVNTIELNLSPTYNDYSKAASTVDVSVSYGDGRDSLWNYANVKTGSSASSIINASGDSHPATVGQEVLMLEGNTGGEKTWITAITGAATTSETWAVSPSLSATPETNSIMSVADLNFSETKTITSTNISDSLTYNISDFYSDNLWIEVNFEVKTGATTLDLHSINIS